ERASLAATVEAYLASAVGGRSDEGAGAALDFLGRVGGEESLACLVQHASPRNRPPVRRHALEALARSNALAGLAVAAVNDLLKFLRDPDFHNVAGPSMAVLERAPLAAGHAAQLLAFVRGNDPALRRFAAAALGQIDTPSSAAALIEALQGDNADLQERAGASLARLHSAVPLAIGAMPEARDPRAAWALSRIVQPHASRLKPKQVETLAAAAAAWLEPGDPRAEAVLSIVRERYLPQLLAACLARVKRLKRNRRAGEVTNLLRPLARDGTQLPADVRYELAVADLVCGRKDLARDARLANPGLQALETLLHEREFALLSRLKRDKTFLSPEEYYLVGSHFAERSYADRAFGGEILRWMVATFPGDTHAQSAAGKLVMEGFPPPSKPRAPAKAADSAAAPSGEKKPRTKKKPRRRAASG
ncbi:MAG: hypothetical protein ACREID_03880, partial [Planctomycetota bacterium]